MSRVPETTSSAPQPAYTVSSLGVVVFGFRTSIRKTAGTGRFALFAIAAVTRKMSPGATESGTPSTVNVTAKPVTCTSFDTVLLRVGVRMPTALAANKTTTKIVARGPSLMPFLPIVRTSPASPRRFERLTPARGDNPAACMHRARRRPRLGSRQPYRWAARRGGGRIVFLWARGSIGGGGVPRARPAGPHGPGRGRPSAGGGGGSAGAGGGPAGLPSQE